MSFLARLSARCGNHDTAPAALPKGLVGHQASPLSPGPLVRRTKSAEDDEPIAPLRTRPTAPLQRSSVTTNADDAPKDEDDPIARQEDSIGLNEPPVHRAVAPGNPVSESQAQSDVQSEQGHTPLRRQDTVEDDPVAPARQPATDDELAPLHMQPLRRQENDAEEDIARQQGDAGEAGPAIRLLRVDSVRPNIAREPNLSGSQALSNSAFSEHSRSAPTMEGGDPAPAGSQPAIQPAATESQPTQLASHDGPVDHTGIPLPSPLPYPAIDPATPGEFYPDLNQSRPDTRVVIEQLDVLIHEPATPPARPLPGLNRERSMRARYLRRL